MAKTNFVDGSPVTPAFLNAINNPTYSENPSQNGEIPFPPAFSPSSSIPRQLNLNSSCRGPSRFGFSTWDFVAYDNTTIANRGESAAAGYSLSTLAENTDMSGIIVANAAGDTERGFWIWNIAGDTPTAGKKIGVFLDYNFSLASMIYQKTASLFEEYEITFQAEIKNDAANGAVATIQAELFAGNEEHLVSSGRIEVVEASAPAVIAPGSSAVIWRRIRVKSNLVCLDVTAALVPALRFTLTTGGNFYFELLGLGIFAGNTFGKKIAVDSDYELARSHRHSIGNYRRAQGYTTKQIVPGIWDNGNSRIYGYIRIPLQGQVLIPGTPVLTMATPSVWRRKNKIEGGPVQDVDVTADAIYTLEAISGNGREALIKVSIPGGSTHPSTFAPGEIYLVDFSGGVEVSVA